MTRLHEELISRYVDGDLNAAETAQARLLIETEPAARAVFEQYTSLSQSLAGLTRHEIPVDMVSRLEPYLSRGNGWRLPVWREFFAANRWLAGALVASVAGVAGLAIFWPGPGPERAQLSSGKMLSASVNEANDPPAANLDEIASKAEVASAKSAVVKVKDVIKPKSAIEPDPTRARSSSPVESFVRQLANVDRRHSIRLHVEAANSRVEDEVLTTLARYRGVGTQIMRVGLTAEGEPPSLRFVALVPTRSVQGLTGQLARQFSNRMELDLPEDIDWLRDHQDQLQPVTSESRIDEKATGEPLLEQNSLKTEKFGPVAEPVADALARPLESVAGDTQPGTLDEVMIQIRTDLLVPEGKKNSSSKSRNRPQPDSRK